MKYIGRRRSQNVEDRRGLSTGRMVAGGGLGTIAIVIIVMLLGGDPTEVLNQIGGSANTEHINTTPVEEEMATFVSVVLADTEEVWHKLFRQMGKTYREPTLVLFRQQVQSACGFSSAASGPFYCSGDGKIYIDLSFCDVLRERFGVHGDFAIAYVIAHEVGHHVQNLLGILEQVQETRQQLDQVEGNQLAVKLELQADFLAGVWAHHAQKMLDILESGDIEEATNAASAVGDDAIQMKTQGRIVPDAFTHGTAKQRKTWFLKGFQTGDLNDGNTFRQGAV